MVSRCRPLQIILITLVLVCGNGSAALADTPAQHIKKTIERVMEIIRESKDETKRAERRQMLRQTLLPRFDFAEMAKRSLGSHWKNQNGRQEEFVAAFTDFVGNAYLIRIESLKDEQVVYGRERVDQGLAAVDTKIVPGKGDPVSINYRLHLVDGEWKVYDVVIDDISVVNNYRSQFNRFLAKSSFDELLQKLREKSAENGG